MVKRQAYTAFIVLTMLLLSPYVNSVELTPTVKSETTGRAQTIWSGNIVLNTNYGVAVTDELVISACTNITMGSGVRIYVDGRLTVEGTKSCPVYFDNAGGGDHMGLQFNTSSNGRGSKIDNASIIHSTYGITIYGSNPYLANVTIFDADDVAIDLFNSATPTIRDLEINESGQDWTIPQYWRYGIGLSVGAGSAPNVDGLKVTNAVTRGLNMWGNSGGLYRNISIDNVTGATLAISAGIWVEDSIPLIQSASVDRSDHGVIVRHITDGAITRAVIRDLDITNSMYVAMILDKEDRTNYTNYQSAVIDGLSISGTGGPSAKTPGLATATLEINATGAWIENSNLEDNSAVGVQLYFVDSTTIFSNLTINNSGGTGTGANAAGISVRSSYFAPTFNNLEVSNSTGPAVFSKSGGAIQGKDWNLHNNGQEGFLLESASTIVENLSLSNNSDSGAHIYDARYVYLYNVSSENNGDAGLLFERANDIETTSGDVKCVNCSSKNDAKGVTIIDSVDLFLESLSVENPVTGSSIVADNGGLNIGVQGGRFHLKDVVTWQNSSLPAISIVNAEAEIDGLEMLGSHAGLHWDADHNQERDSILSNASLSGTDCLILSNHDQLYGHNINITNDCLGDLDFTNVKLNWTDFEDFGTHVLIVDTNSNLHLHKPVNIDYQSAVISGNGWIEEAWDVQVWVLNNNSNGVPSAVVELGFDQLESEIDQNTDEYGWASFPDLRGKKYTSQGESPYTAVTINCSYDSVTNSTSTILDQDRVIWCHLPLANQAPFLIWDTPVDQTVFPSKSEVIFNASRSWDLDDDSLTFKWYSSIDGVLLEGPMYEFTANEEGIPTPLVNLSDGIHNIELEICDVDFCVSETRTIELANQPPLIVFSTDPALNPWGELISPITKTVHYDLNGTYDPENDSLTCSWSWLSSFIPISDCASEGNLTFESASTNVFDLTLSVEDGINPPSEYVIPVELYNEMPTASFEVLRDSNYSENEVTLVSTSSDPEGDEIEFFWTSNIDGILSNDSSWSGYLSRGSHVITLSVNDGRMEHLNLTSVNQTILIVENSKPRAVISNPNEGMVIDSSTIIEFNSSGSGDWDSACSTFPGDIDWHCSDTEPTPGSEYLVYKWESNIDGVLQEDGTDWLIFESRLSTGNHVITLSMDDGINPISTSTVNISVGESAPVLGLINPETNTGYQSSDLILFDIRDSQDFDGDNFTFSLSSNISNSILESVSPYEVHPIRLDAGHHLLSVELVDETGLSRIENITLQVIESDPVVVIYSPLNNQFYEPGQTVILDSNGTFDADGDITIREWRHHIASQNYPQVLSNNAYFETSLPPGVHHLSLYVEDRRGGNDEVHVNITIASSNPDLSNLSLSESEFEAGKLNEISVSVQLQDLDGTTDLVHAVIKKGEQEWPFNLTDEDGDGFWIGSIEILVTDPGKAQLKVTAVDGEIIDYVTKDIDFVETETDNSALMNIIIGASGFVVVLGLLALIVLRRRKRLADLDLIDSWGVFGGDVKEYLENEDEFNK